MIVSVVISYVLILVFQDEIIEIDAERKRRTPSPKQVRVKTSLCASTRLCAACVSLSLHVASMYVSIFLVVNGCTVSDYV